MNSASASPPDTATETPSRRTIRWIPWVAAAAAASATAAVVTAGPPARKAPEPIKPGEKVALDLAYQGYSPSGDLVNILVQPGVEGNSETGTESPTYAGIGVEFDQYPGNRAKNKAYLVAYVRDDQHGVSLVSGKVTVGDKSYAMEAIDDAGSEGLIVKMDCSDVPRSTALPIRLVVQRSNGSEVTAAASIDSRSIDSAGRSCTPDGSSLA